MRTTFNEEKRTTLPTRSVLPWLKALSLVLVAATVSGCAGAKSYLGDRGRDAADIFNCTVGLGMGTAVRMSAVHAGLYAGITPTGLRGGRMYVFAPGGYDFAENACLESFLPFVRDEDNYYREMFKTYPVGDQNYEGRHKSMAASDRGKQIEDASSTIPFVTRKFERVPDDTRTCLHPYFTDMNVRIGVVLGIDLGFNPGELVDFLLGWTTVDIFEDDLGQRQTGEEGEKPVEAKKRTNTLPAFPPPSR